jgi:hypothetical protein
MLRITALVVSRLLSVRLSEVFVQTPKTRLRKRARDRERFARVVRHGFGVPRWAWLTFAGYLAVYLSWQAWHWIPANQELVGDLAFWPITILSAITAWRAGERARGSRRVRAAWRLVAGAMVSYLLANVAQFVYEVVLGAKPYPSLADVGFLAFYPLMLAALLRFPCAPLERTKRRQRVIDVAITALAGTMAVWYIVLGPVAIAGGEIPTLAVSIAYPVGDMILILGILSRRSPTGSSNAT